MSEQVLQTKILKYLESRGFWVVKIIRANRSGIPDILALSPEGELFGIEVKFGKNTASELQKYHLNEIAKRKGKAILAYSLEDVKECVI